MKGRFRIKFLDEANDFLDSLDNKIKEKILYNIWKVSVINDKELFKILTKRQMKTYTLEEITDKHIGEKGTSKRDTFDEKLRLDI